jgi:hypothetical protein
MIRENSSTTNLWGAHASSVHDSASCRITHGLKRRGGEKVRDGKDAIASTLEACAPQFNSEDEVRL